jgi:hypothetical protein
VSVQDLILGKNKKVRISAGQFDFIELDCTESEDYRFELDVTQHPIESGGVITDHIIRKPVSLTLNGFVTNHATARTFMNFDFTRAEDCYTLLRNWMDEGQKLTVETSLDEIDDLILRNFSTSRDHTTSNTLPVKLDFIQITTVESQVSNVKAPVPKIKAAEKPKTKGKQPTKPKEPRTSVLKGGGDKAVGAVKGFFGVK